MTLGVFGEGNSALRDACFGRKRVAAPLWNTAHLHNLGCYLPASVWQHQSDTLKRHQSQKSGVLGLSGGAPARLSSRTKARPIRIRYPGAVYPVMARDSLLIDPQVSRRLRGQGF